MKKTFFLTMIALSIYLILNVLIQNIEENPIKLKNKNNLILKAFPQGWAFFTKEIPKYRFTLYKIETDGSFAKMQTKNTTTNNYWGLKKSNRILPHFIEKKFSSIKESFWLKSTQNSNEIDAKSLNTYKLSSKDKSIEGYYLIEMYKTNSWVYFSNNIIDENKYYIKIKIE